MALMQRRRVHPNTVWSQPPADLTLLDFQLNVQTTSQDVRLIGSN